MGDPRNKMRKMERDEAHWLMRARRCPKQVAPDPAACRAAFAITGCPSAPLRKLNLASGLDP